MIIIRLKVLPAFATSSSAFPLCPSSWTASAREGVDHYDDDDDDGDDDDDDGVDGVDGNCLGRCVYYIHSTKKK